ncbi:BrnT family toxin [Sphingomonas melonis]|uniref:BrnT family toxin n=1 Tax=Sphingomonas melonis TaxID=152682 RepID=A0A7Y9K0J9_9SPHN|nr:BrnT family toxin [Sphingomonas melonis]NYD89001.1 hypothetical protein [Sphingomonas melonis]
MAGAIGFDPEKRVQTLDERGLDVLDAARVFDFEDRRVDYPEARWSTIGFSDERMVVVICTGSKGGRRVRSMRKANEREQARFRRSLA